MADIKVCDRCGKKLTDERTHFSLRPIYPNRYILDALLYKPMRYSYNGGLELVKTAHDLCPECTLALSKWLENESKEEST